MLERKDYQTLDNLFTFVAVFIDQSTYRAPSGSTYDEVSTRYSEIVIDLNVYMGQRESYIASEEEKIRTKGG